MQALWMQDTFICEKLSSDFGSRFNHRLKKLKTVFCNYLPSLALKKVLYSINLIVIPKRRQHMCDPVDHHYLPQFYLTKWVGADHQICKFSRPYGNQIISARVSPKGTAYEEHLYSMHKLDGPPDPEMERNFMAKLDAEAAEAMRCLAQRLPENKWRSRLGSAWSRFIWAQSIRTPSEIEQLKSIVKEKWSAAIPDLQKHYYELKPNDAPDNIDDYLSALDPYAEDRFALQIARRCMDHSGISQIIDNMHWKVLDFGGCGIPLFTSDRPVWMTTTLSEPDAFITMPISPNQLFIATRENSTLTRLDSKNRRQQAKRVNKLTVEHAVKFVFGVDNTMQDFVQKYFANKRHSTHMERLANMYGHPVTANCSLAQ